MAKLDERNSTIDSAEANTIINFGDTETIGMFRMGSTADTKIKAWYYNYGNKVVISWPDGKFSTEQLHEFEDRNPDPTNGTCVENFNKITNS